MTPAIYLSDLSHQKIRSYGKRRGRLFGTASATLRTKRQALFESLERRQLLSADLVYELPVPLAFDAGISAETYGQSESQSAYAAETPSPNAPGLGTTFEAINFNGDAANSGFYHIPPDPIGAAGPNHVVNVVNTSIEWYTKSGTQQFSDQLEDFFAPLQPANDTFDPKVLYDQHAGRFVVVTLERVDTGSPGPHSGNTSRALLAVSDTSDPNGNWSFQAINTKLSPSGTEAWFDYPGFAVDEEAIYLTGNLFAFSGDGGSYQGTFLWIVDKGLGSGGLYDGLTSSFTTHDVGTIGAIAVTTQPAHVYGAAPSNTGTWLVQHSGLNNGTDEFVNVIRIDNPVGSPTFDQDFVNIGNLDNQGAMPNAPQLGSPVEIETNDRRALNAVWRDNSLWMSTTIVPNSGPDAGQATAHWVEIDTSTLTTPALADQGNVGGEDLATDAHTFFPSVTVDSAGNMGIGFAISGPTIYGSAAYTGRLAGDAAGTVQPAAFLAQGLAPYVRAFGGTRNRWGDYSGIAIDPADDETFWIFNEYALGQGNNFGQVFQGQVEDGRWGTRWGSFKFSTVVGNDNFASRIDLGSAATAFDTGTNVGYTSESGEPPQSGVINSAWWSWTAPANGTVVVDTVGSDFDTYLTLATGSAVNALTVVDQNDDFFGLQSQITAPVIGGAQYQIAVDGYSSDTGAISLNLDFTTGLEIGETGQVSVDGNWRTVTLQNTYNDPVVIAQPPSLNGADPSTVRIRNVQPNSFEVQIDEWDYLDGSHASESVSYLVVESGAHVLADGTFIQAGSEFTDQDFIPVNYPWAFGMMPVVLTQSQTRYGSSAIVTRQRNVTASGFEVRVQEEQGQDGTHAFEQVGFIAMEPGSGYANNGAYSIGRTGDVVTDSFHTISFGGSFTTPPIFLAGMQSFDGPDPAGLRFRNLSGTSVEVFVEEERSADTEVAHTTEDVGFAAFAAAGTLMGQPIIGETGSHPAAGSWTTVFLSQSYIDPVVIAQPPSFNGGDPCTVRIRNVMSDSFEMQIDEWDYLDGSHVDEIVGYVVMERGTYFLPDGRTVQADTVTANHNFSTVPLPPVFENVPVVLAQSQTINGPSAIVTRLRDVTTNSFDVRVQEEEGQDGTHANETIGYLAIETGTTGTAANQQIRVGRTGDVVTDQFHSISFSFGSNFSLYDPFFLASIQTFDGDDPTGLRFQNLSVNGVQVFAEEERSADSETTHTTEVVGFAAFSNFAAPGVPLYGAPVSVIGESGTRSVNHNWQTVTLTRSYRDPVVIAQPPSFNGSDPCNVRIRNVTSNSFQMQIDEWDYLDGSHASESVSYFVAERGTHSLPGGTVLNVGKVDADDAFTAVTLPPVFDSAPVVLSQSQTLNGSSAILTRQRNATLNGFDVRVQEEQGQDGTHATESIGYIAHEVAVGNLGGANFQVGQTGNSVTDAFHSISFASGFSSPPAFLAGLQTFNGSDPAGLRYRNLSASGAEVFAEEETSADTETTHVAEVVGFFALSAGTQLYGDTLGTIGSAASLSNGETQTPIAKGLKAETRQSWTNPTNPLDINDDSLVTPLDALIAINTLNRMGSVDLVNFTTIGSSTSESGYFDVSGDGALSPVDVLVVVNYLNRHPVPVAQASHTHLNSANYDAEFEESIPGLDFPDLNMLTDSDDEEQELVRIGLYDQYFAEL